MFDSENSVTRNAFSKRKCTLTVALRIVSPTFLWDWEGVCCSRRSAIAFDFECSEWKKAQTEVPPMSTESLQPPQCTWNATIMGPGKLTNFPQGVGNVKFRCFKTKGLAPPGNCVFPMPHVTLNKRSKAYPILWIWRARFHKQWWLMWGLWVLLSVTISPKGLPLHTRFPICSVWGFTGSSSWSRNRWRYGNLPLWVVWADVSHWSTHTLWVASRLWKHRKHSWEYQSSSKLLAPPTDTQWWQWCSCNTHPTLRFRRPCDLPRCPDNDLGGWFAEREECEDLYHGNSTIHLARRHYPFQQMAISVGMWRPGFLRLCWILGFFVPVF